MNSLPQHRGSCNTRNPEKTAARIRRVQHLAVSTDKRLPMGARVLYDLLDDYAGMKGVCWPKQTTLAHRLGASRQSVQRWIAALERAGWLATERTRRAHRYTLKWAAARASDSGAGGQRISIPQPVVIESAQQQARQPEPAAEPPAPRRASVVCSPAKRAAKPLIERSGLSRVSREDLAFLADVLDMGS